MDATDKDGAGSTAQQWRAEATWSPGRDALAPSSAAAPAGACARSLAGALSSGATDVLRAVEDCVDEIRFHQSALVRSLQRRSSMAHCLNELIATVSLQTGARKASADPDRAAATALARSAEVLPGPPARAAHAPAAGAAPHPGKAAARPCLAVFCLGPMRMLQDDRPIEDWPNGKGKTVFKYLLLHHRQPVAKERLMQLFWPDADAECARNNLNVTIYGIRKVLGRAQPGISHIVLEDGCYRLNAGLDLWLDAEVFEERARLGREHESCGRVDEAIAAYREAERLYHGDLFAEDRAEDWCLPARQRIRDCALDLLRRLVRLSLAREDANGAVTANRRLLEIDPCDEEAHRELMRLYARLDQPHLAVRQFRACADALSRELHMIPSPETTALYRRIQRREAP